MKYERLTDKNNLYWAIQETPLTAEIGIYLTDCLNRLAELEDKIEQGTLKEIPEGAVVLTMEEWEKYQTTQRDWNAIYFDGIEKTRKETAEKFAERLVGKAFVEFGDDDYDRLCWLVGEICKEITEGKV